MAKAETLNRKYRLPGPKFAAKNLKYVRKCEGSVR